MKTHLRSLFYNLTAYKMTDDKLRKLCKGTKITVYEARAFYNHILRKQRPGWYARKMLRDGINFVKGTRCQLEDLYKPLYGIYFEHSFIWGWQLRKTTTNLKS